MSYYIELEEDQNGDLILEIPEEVIEVLGWETNDLLTWDLRGDGVVVQKLNSKLDE